MKRRRKILESYYKNYFCPTFAFFSLLLSRPSICFDRKFSRIKFFFSFKCMCKVNILVREKAQQSHTTGHYTLFYKKESELDMNF